MKHSSWEAMLKNNREKNNSNKTEPKKLQSQSFQLKFHQIATILLWSNQNSEKIKTQIFFQLKAVHFTLIISTKTPFKATTTTTRSAQLK